MAPSEGETCAARCRSWDSFATDTSSMPSSMRSKSSQVKPSQAKPSQAEPSQAEPSQAQPSPAKPSSPVDALFDPQGEEKPLDGESACLMATSHVPCTLHPAPCLMTTSLEGGVPRPAGPHSADRIPISALKSGLQQYSLAAHHDVKAATMLPAAGMHQRTRSHHSSSPPLPHSPHRCLAASSGKQCEEAANIDELRAAIRKTCMLRFSNVPLEIAIDTDGDGKPDSVVIDVDGDGVGDVVRKLPARAV